MILDQTDHFFHRAWIEVTGRRAAGGAVGDLHKAANTDDFPLQMSGLSDRLLMFVLRKRIFSGCKRLWRNATELVTGLAECCLTGKIDIRTKFSQFPRLI